MVSRISEQDLAGWCELTFEFCSWCIGLLSYLVRIKDVLLCGTHLDKPQEIFKVVVVILTIDHILWR